MKTVLILVALSVVACKAPKPAAVSTTPGDAVPGAVAPMEQNQAEKYVSGLQADVKRAQAAKEKADAAIKKTDEAQKTAE